jgi:hypothetical protein
LKLASALKFNSPELLDEEVAYLGMKTKYRIGKSGKSLAFQKILMFKRVI